MISRRFYKADAAQNAFDPKEHVLNSNRSGG